MAFPGAAGAALVGAPLAWGYYVACAAAAVVIGAIGGNRERRARLGTGERAAAIGLVQAAGLALGFLFVSLYGGVLGDLESELFGTFLGVSDARLIALAVVAAIVLAGLAALARPLLFASVDPDVAGARGVPVGALGAVFMLLLGLAVAATSQVTGALLVFALLVGPPASAQVLTARPVASLLLTVGIGLAVAWLGLGIAYFSPYPAGFFVASLSFGVYVLARVATAMRGRRGSRLAPAAPAAPPVPGEVLA
jgi:zinc/manganese transport system permease protein